MKRNRSLELQSQVWSYEIFSDSLVSQSLNFLIRIVGIMQILRKIKVE